MPVPAAVARRPSPQVLDQAADWLVRLTAGDATDADRDAWRRWLAADPEHARAWAGIETLTQKFGVVPPRVGLAALDRPQSLARRRALEKLVLLVSVGGAGWLGYRHLAADADGTLLHTGKEAPREVLLADGTRVVLDAGTRLEVAFDATQRLLVLGEGRVLVETAADPAVRHRPFVVATRDGRLTALGTRFSVRQCSQGSRLAVYDGAVEIRPRDPAAGVQVLQAGQRTRFDAGSIAPARPVDEQMAAWASGMLFADRMPLGAFVEQLAHYRHGWLRCDPAVAGLRISGAFPLDDTDRVLAALADALPVRIESLTPYWVTVGPR